MNAKIDAGKGKATRELILDASERIMVSEGYAAVTSRRVAEEAGFKSQLLHYHFGTMDDLFLALFARSENAFTLRHVTALASDDPLRNFWKESLGSSVSRLTIEFMAAANHRKALRAELVRSTERIRSIQLVFMERVLKDLGISSDVCPPNVFSSLITILSQALAMEAQMGFSSDHNDVLAFIEHWLDVISPPKAPSRTGKGARSPGSVQQHIG